MTQSKAQDFGFIKAALSVDRFESYRRVATEPDELVFRRHQWNSTVSTHFYRPLQLLEILLRNSFDMAISAKIKNPDWLGTVPAWLQGYGKDCVAEAHEFLQERGRPITQSRVVQELSFGFWTSLLNGKYETLFHGIGATVFPGMPRSIRTRSEASSRLEAIRNLRNRIFHFRRIWNRADLAADFRQILDTIDWIKPGAKELLSDGAEARFEAALAQKL